MVYVTCPDDQVAEKTAKKIIKNKLCSSINVYPGAEDYMYWKMMQSQHKKNARISKFINICEKTTTPYERVVSKKGKDGKKKRKTEKGNNKEVLVVVKTTMACFDKLSQLVDTVATRVLHYEKDVMSKANAPKFGSKRIEVAASVVGDEDMSAKVTSDTASKQ